MVKRRRNETANTIHIPASSLCASVLCAVVSLITDASIRHTRSPLEDSRLFVPSPWKFLATTYEQKRFLSNPAPGENLLSGNLVMETGCMLSNDSARRRLVSSLRRHLLTPKKLACISGGRRRVLRVRHWLCSGAWF